MATLTYSDIQTRVMNSLRIPTSNATEATKVAALVNEVYRDIYVKYDWYWLVKREVLTTSDDINTGTLSVTNNSTAITFSSAPTPSTAGRKLLVTGNTDSGAVYRVASHTAASTSATLDDEYTGDTNATAAYRVFHDTYDLASDCGKVLHVTRYGFFDPIDDIGAYAMLDLKAYDQSVGKPQYYAVIDFDTTGDSTTQRQLVIHPYPDSDYRLEVHYKRTLNTELSGTTRPLIPDDYAQVLVYGTLARAFPVMLNDTERGTFYQNLFNDVMALMTAQHRQSETPPRFIPQDVHRRYYRSRNRVNTQRMNLGSYFDRWPVNP